MTNKKRITEDDLQDVFSLTVKKIKEKLNDPECTSSDIKNALQLLKDNHIEIDLEEKENLLKKLGLTDKSLPFQGENSVIN